MSVFNRLYSEGQERLKKLEESQHKRKKQKDPNCTFAPMTNHNSTVFEKDISRSNRKRRKQKPKPTVQNVVEALLQTVDAGADKAGAVSMELYGQIFTDLMSAVLDEWQKEEHLTTQQEKTRDPAAHKNATSNTERFKRLYKDAMDKRARDLKLQKEHLKHLPADCTFSPRINRYKGVGQDSNVARGSKLYEELYSGAQRQLEKRNKLHAEAKERMPSNCTFKPRINKYSQPADNVPGKSRFARLYDDGAAKRKKRQEEIVARRLEVERMRREEDSIAPMLPDGVTALRPARLRKKSKQRSVAKKSDMEAATAEPLELAVPESQEPTKKPSRSFFGRSKSKTKPKKASKKKKMSKVREDALKKKKDKTNARRQMRQKEISKSKGKNAQMSNVAFSSTLKQGVKPKQASDMNSIGLEQCTFSPQICRTGPKDKREGTVFFRLQKQGKAMQERSRQREKAHPHGCTFKPSITRVARSTKSESVSKRFQRLYLDHEKRMAKRGKSDLQLPLGCTFAPDVTLSKSTFEGSNEVISVKPARPKLPQSQMPGQVRLRPTSEGRILKSATATIAIESQAPAQSALPRETSTSNNKSENGVSMIKTRDSITESAKGDEERPSEMKKSKLEKLNQQQPKPNMEKKSDLATAATGADVSKCETKSQQTRVEGLKPVLPISKIASENPVLTDPVTKGAARKAADAANAGTGNGSDTVHVNTTIKLKD